MKGFRFLTAVLYSGESSRLRELCAVLQQLKVGVEHFTEAEGAVDRLLKTKVDALIVDCEAPAAERVVAALRRSASNRRDVAIGIGNNLQDAFALGVNFAVQLPLERGQGLRGLRAAYGLMIRERLRYFRVTASLPVEVLFDDGRLLSTRTRNLSTEGANLQLSERFADYNRLAMRLELPTSSKPLDIKGRVVWRNQEHAAGVQFTEVPASTAALLHEWVSESFQRDYGSALDHFAAAACMPSARTKIPTYADTAACVA